MPMVTLGELALMCHECHEQNLDLECLRHFCLWDSPKISPLNSIPLWWPTLPPADPQLTFFPFSISTDISHSSMQNSLTP